MEITVSVIIRTHNAECYLPALLESLQKQTYRNYEVIAVLNQCTDTSEEILRSAGASIVNYPTDQPFNYSRALNLGAEAAHGKYLLNLSSHVELVKDDTLEKMVWHIENENLAAISVKRRFQSEHFGRHEGLDFTAKKNFHGWGGLANYCGMIPKDLWNKHPFGEPIPTVEDSAWAAFWIYRGHRTAVLNGHAVLYKNPRYSASKLLRERAVIALFLTSLDPSKAFLELSMFTWNNAKRFFSYRRPSLWRYGWVELATTWQLRLLSRSKKKQETIRRQLLREYPGLDEYVENFVREPVSKTTNA